MRCADRIVLCGCAVVRIARYLGHLLLCGCAIDRTAALQSCIEADNLTGSKQTSRAVSTFASPARVVPGAAPAPATKKARANASKTAVVRDAKEEAEKARLEALRQHRAAAAAASAAAARPKPRSVPAASSSKAVSGGMHATIADDSLIWEP